MQRPAEIRQVQALVQDLDMSTMNNATKRVRLSLMLSAGTLYRQTGTCMQGMAEFLVYLWSQFAVLIPLPWALGGE